jgi:hypothetical protein
VNRKPAIGIAGVIAASVLVVIISANSLGGSPGASPSPGQVAAQPTPTAAIETSGPSSTPLASPSPSPTPLPTPVTVPAPLTGRLVAPDVAARHPIAVMIDDLGPARPQSGLSSASVVWQAPAEGGIPRYMAIFQENLPGTIGPVRSSRYYYIAWAAEWRALYAHSGGSPQALQTLRAKGSGQYVFNGDEFRYSGTFHRVFTRAAPHNLYTSGAKLRALAARLGATDKLASPVWQFASDAPLDARPYGGTITVGYPYNVIRYTYDRTTNTYLRSVSGEPRETDAGTGIRIAPKNVIVMRMVFGPLNDGHPGAPRLEANVVGSGTAWISTNGRTIRGTWKKAGITKPTRFFDASGNQVTLTVGQTFIQVLTTSTSLYPATFRPGSDQPPATPAASASTSGG